MSDYTFASLPSVSIPRTKFHRTFTHNNSFNLGELVVLGVDEVIPGSTHKLEFGSLIRMSTPIAPIMDDIQYDVFAFFVPMRLTWDNWKRFMGENTSGSGALNGTNSDKTIPYVDVGGSDINTIADDLGIYPGSIGAGSRINVLPFRAVKLIYNRWFRNQNIEAPIPVNTGDTSDQSDFDYTGLYHFNGTTVSAPTSGEYPVRLKADKLPDYFTSALPYAQKGDPVKIPGTEYATLPVVTGDRHVINTDHLTWKYTGNGNNVAASGAIGSNTGDTAIDTTNTFTPGAYVVPDNLYAIFNKTQNTINDLRFAFQLQKFLEKDALYGSRYWEILHAHYAVTAPDASLQDPQLLGAAKFDIQINQVLQTTGFVDQTSTTLGTPGANSVTGHKGHLYTASFVEHGYIITIGVARQKKHTYSASLNRMWLRSARTDFYFPVFANLGAQTVKNREIYPNSNDAIGNAPFGFQEAWAEYRYLPSYNSGLLNPYRPNSLDYWTLADKYNSTPTLSTSFIKEDRSNLIRALVTGATGPDFIGSWYFKDTVVNPMPVYSIPGLADHH